MWVLSWGREVSLEKEMATHSGILAWEISRNQPLAQYFKNQQKKLKNKKRKKKENPSCSPETPVRRGGLPPPAQGAGRFLVTGWVQGRPVRWKSPLWHR